MKLADYVRFRQALLDEATDMGIAIDGMAPLPKDMLKTIDGVKPLDAVSPAPDPTLVSLHVWSDAPADVAKLTVRVRMQIQRMKSRGQKRLDEDTAWQTLGFPRGGIDIPWIEGQTERGLRAMLNRMFALHGWKYNAHFRCYNDYDHISTGN